MPLQERASQTLGPGMQPLKGNSLPLYLLVRDSTRTCFGGSLQSKVTTSHWNWYIRRALPVPLPYYSVCCFNSKGMISLSSTNQGGTCSQMHWAGAPAEDLRKSSWTCMLTMLPLTRHGSPNWRKQPGGTLPLEQSISLPSKVGHIKGDTLPGWPGRIGTSEMSYQQMMACYWKDLTLSYCPASMRSTLRDYITATCQLGRSKRMPDNTCIGLDWMLISQTTLEDARNASARHTLPKSHCKLMMSPTSHGNTLWWIISIAITGCIS